MWSCRRAAGKLQQCCRSAAESCRELRRRPVWVLEGAAEPGVHWGIRVRIRVRVRVKRNLRVYRVRVRVIGLGLGS